MKTKKILCMILSFIMAMLTLSGCGSDKTGSEGEQANNLEIYILDAGYGTEWLKDIKAAFAEEEWVQEKYPNLQIDISSNAEQTFAEGKITAGSKANEFDILFGVNLQTLFGKRGSDKQPLLADLTDVYEGTVPGEEVKVGDKLLESAKIANQYTDLSGETHYYSLPWAGGLAGILYNADLLAEYGEVPVTTDQMLDIMAKITKDRGYSIIQSSNGTDGACYWEHLFPTWWGQYEGYEGYMSFWNGQVNGEYSKDIFKQQGRLESLKTLEKVLGTKSKNLYESSNALSFMEAQTNFLIGNGVFMACGDWFDREMSVVKEGLKKEGYDYDIQMMKTPVISSIINKTPSIKDDATLAAVVKAVDNGETSYAGVTAEDFAIIAEARQIVFSVGNLHNAVVPEYSTSKELAKDFLRYLATDTSNEIYAKQTGGSGMFYKYDLQAKNPDLYKTLSGTARMRADFFSNSIYPAKVLPSPNNFNLFIYGGVRPLNATQSNQFEILFTQKNPKTAQEIFDADIKYWSDSVWSTVLVNIGAN